MKLFKHVKCWTKKVPRIAMFRTLVPQHGTWRASPGPRRGPAQRQSLSKSRLWRRNRRQIFQQHATQKHTETHQETSFNMVHTETSVSWQVNSSMNSTWKAPNFETLCDRRRGNRICAKLFQQLLSFSNIQKTKGHKWHTEASFFRKATVVAQVLRYLEQMTRWHANDPWQEME